MRGGSGYRQRRLGDDWFKAIDARLAAEQQPIQPSQHVGAAWGHACWPCPAHGTGDARPTERIAEPPSGA